MARIWAAVTSLPIILRRWQGFGEWAEAGNPANSALVMRVVRDRAGSRFVSPGVKPCHRQAVERVPSMVNERAFRSPSPRVDDVPLQHPKE